ncbi:Panacea domain-containing protein [Steroidobacter cummioxidans]|uniref:Panacea domain-containing protein n=1 Tax=Steroidobacter cummioxidans TaxID=1803913 RepID=UPI000E310E85|nr:Panacea domain-containing protein [Steroidobacter cummioxidans]
MPANLPAFDAEKAVEVIAYTASRAGTDLYVTLKLLYLADKLHLERYGRFIFGDWYAALEYGPVASHAYDIMKHARGDRPVSLAKHARAVLRVDPQTNAITILREPDLDELSRSDLECLDEAIEKYSKLGFGEIKRLTHDDAYNATARNGQISVESIAATTKRAAELIQHLSDPHPDRR